MVLTAAVPVDAALLAKVFPERAETPEGREALAAWVATLHAGEIRSVADLRPLARDDALWRQAVPLPVPVATRLRIAIQEEAASDLPAAASSGGSTEAAPTAATADAPPASNTVSPAAGLAPNATTASEAPPSQLDIVVVDVSRSMKSASAIDVLKTREDVSKLVFHALIDGLACLEHDHRCGVLGFGARVDGIDMATGLPVDLLADGPDAAARQLRAYAGCGTTADMESCHTHLGRMDATQNRTRLYDAVVAAAEAAALHADALMAGPNPPPSRPLVRVFALTDGQDNASKATPIAMVQRLRELGATLDAFPMAGMNADLYAACELTGGLCVSVTSEVQAVELFQDEVVLHVDCRDRPAELPPCTADEFARRRAACPAVAAVTVQHAAPTTKASSAAATQALLERYASTPGSNPPSAPAGGAATAPGAALKRVAKELRDAIADPGLSAVAEVRTNGEDLLSWVCALRGRDGTPYAGRWFRLSVVFPPDYPFKPPRVRFETPMYHPNINSNGAICLDILKDQWSPALTISKVLLSLDALLADPNPDDPLVPSVAEMYKLRRAEFDAQARAWAGKHGFELAALALS